MNKTKVYIVEKDRKLEIVIRDKKGFNLNARLSKKEARNIGIYLLNWGMKD